MKKKQIFQIKELAKSIVKYDHLSDEDFLWISMNFSKKDLKLLMFFLAKEIKNKKVLINFAGEFSEIKKEIIINLFKNKTIMFNRDDKNIICGMYIEYEDFILDYSVSGTIKKMFDTLRKRL
ncbi:MAG: F0F1 ATP synthase subunit delta [Endomicrobium sp.]|jgi:hypothetical protein|nr:F0F1 ATP synthase subunit delta [Endomicrobium sp.]